jgi:hypothetical protein
MFLSEKERKILCSILDTSDAFPVKEIKKFDFNRNNIGRVGGHKKPII